MYLCQNNLNGPIPKQLTGLSSLSTALDLSSTSLIGPIPTEVDEVPVQGVFNNATALFIVENTRLCGGIPQLKLSKWKRRESANLEFTFRIPLLNVSYGDLFKATDSFSEANLIGSGSLNDFKALVYEFMVNGSREKWLHPSHSANLGEEHNLLSLIDRLPIHFPQNKLALFEYEGPLDILPQDRLLGTTMHREH
ncbi:putative receptor-like protein kinase At3g47110 [Ziziphus jujuba]|uniref:Receptor-like protein kinase At3g47110 n=1 Tax=Ziziphus jujuba TaxID=326968 RepID=A0ABM4A9B9_ZIZJJ|nr:putative receptor-like protein kinase At3g47110 [Ziziphus jujuba]